MKKALDVYLKGDLVGTLIPETDSSLIFLYDKEYLETDSIAISVSLPRQKTPIRGSQVRNFFSGLLPDEEVRTRLAEYLKLSENNAFSLLEAVGGDCAGAIVLYPKNMNIPEITDDSEILDDKKLQDILELIKEKPLLAHDRGYRLSLAGAQNKLAVRFNGGDILLMKNGAATTHIIKPMIDSYHDTTYNELFCMRLAKAVGLQVPKTYLRMLGNTSYYMVERYDRIIHKNGTVERMHQEDFCQAMGIAPEKKYEAEGGPKIKHCQELITKHSNQPAKDKIKFLDMAIFNYLVGNGDAHGKNFSFLYTGDKLSLAPAYDIISTAVYPNLSAHMAMMIDGKSKNLRVKSFYTLVSDTKVAYSIMDKQIISMTDKILEKASQLKNNLIDENISSPVFDDIISIIEERVISLLR